MRRRTIVLGIAAAGAVAAVVIVALPHHESPQRKAVSRYLTSVNAIQQQMAYSLTQVKGAYQTFATAHAVAPAEERRLAQAERTLGKLESRIAALDPPPQALRLRRLILQVVKGERGVTHEIDALVRFAPRFDLAVTDLRNAARVLSRRLAAARAPTPHTLHGTPQQVKQAQASFAAAATAAAAAQADAVTAYDTAVTGIIGRLRRMSPPPAFAPAYRAQLASLRAAYRAGGRLAAELRLPNRSRVSALSRAFEVASRISQTVAAQRAEIAAVKAYDGRVRAVGTAAAAVRTELTRLQQNLPS
jgi:hypothetical protein